MPKINVYLPDDLAEAVKDAGVPVSAICQRALEQAVRRITTIRETVLGEPDAAELAGRLPRFTERARAVVGLAVARARTAAAPEVGTEHLLGGMVEEGGNLALHVLRAIEIDPAHVLRDLERRGAAAEGADGGAAARFSGPAAAALELTVTEATALGHNYVGCEHLLLGLVTEPDGVAGLVLRGLGAEPRATRRAVTTALAGYVHLRAQASASASGDPAEALAAAVGHQMRPLIDRIERLEQRLDAAPGLG
ncbi:Clp protease N-terminal domain-containing protein [Actinomadura roseirufa]|uniref:Clp protease N-terminal domain-containing protein n=1 Tax=Actinomadura roseirufa TaxID=2094049 RepID=UPI001041B45A|nr:Clp protease N-terminal domain-containing protein [Actinomadura roseirufa]